MKLEKLRREAVVSRSPVTKVSSISAEALKNVIGGAGTCIYWSHKPK